MRDDRHIPRSLTATKPFDLEAERTRLATLSPAEALRAIAGLELRYRESDDTLRLLPELHALLNDTVYRAWAAHMQDPAAVPLHPLWDAIHDTLRHRPERRFLGRPFDWHAARLDTWLRQYTLTRLQQLTASLSEETTSLSPKAPTSLTSTDLRILSHLRRADLYPWLGPDTSLYRSLLTTILS